MIKLLTNLIGYIVLALAFIRFMTMPQAEVERLIEERETQARYNRAIKRERPKTPEPESEKVEFVTVRYPGGGWGIAEVMV